MLPQVLGMTVFGCAEETQNLFLLKPRPVASRQDGAPGPILEAVPLQLFSYRFAVLNGPMVDSPRNLMKSSGCGMRTGGQTHHRGAPTGINSTHANSLLLESIALGDNRVPNPCEQIALSVC